jgi:uncharacterized repeat protein (TIGR02543 family)
MLCRSPRLLFAAVILAIGFMSAPSARPATSRHWSDVSPSALVVAGERLITPDRYRALSLDRAGLGVFLARVPREGSRAAAFRSEIELPLPDGSFGRFAIVESPIMAPELQIRYPEIRTYAGYGIDDPSATVRFDLTPAGFHALIFTAGGTIYIDPIQRGNDRHYQSYFKRDLRSDKVFGGCTLVDEDGMAAEIQKLVAAGLQGSGAQLRTYRIAVAATGEYTAFHGGTVAMGLAAVVTSMNRVNGIYEKELSIRMVLVANNDLIIYTNSSTDPYANTNGDTMLGQNQTNLDAVIGSANYDIGHVFSTGGGGIASLGVVCRASQKAKGVTGSSSPIGDAFDIDYVAHEIGHQFGANHPFNGNSGNCTGTNRNGSTAYEPGSGSTIMAYAGICSPQNLQPHSDDYFLWISIQEIISYSTSGSGNGCPVTTPTGVVAPVAEAGSGGFAIPISTPFALTASASSTGSPSFCWEEADLGLAGAPDSPVGNAPVFRSFDPTAGPTRTFPKASDLLNNVHTIGELLPSYARTLSFKVTVRDVQAGGVGIADDTISFRVAAAGPFVVTSPNTAVSWPGGSQQTITWNVAGTTGPPIHCANVNLLLSTDGGTTFPTVLVAGTPNDGSELVTLPGTPTTLARVKVEAEGNVFFDISNANFTISPPPTGACCASAGTCTVTTQAACVSPGSWQGAGTSCTPTPCVQSFTITSSADTNGSITPGGAVTVVSGASQAFVITPHGGHHIADVRVDGASVGAVAGYDFTSVTANHTIAASFATDSCLLTVNIVGAGSVTRAPDQVSYEFGAPVILTSVPATGFTFVGWSGDTSTTTSPLTIVMDGSRTYTATFADSAAPTVEVTAPNGGEVLSLGQHASLVWIATDGVGVTSIDLLLSRDGEAGPFDSIAAGVANSGSYDWLVTEPATTNAFLKVIAHDAAGSAGSDLSDAAFSIAGSAGVGDGPVTAFALSAVMPNPAHDLARIGFALPSVARIRIAVLDVQGREVLALVDGEYDAGRHQAVFPTRRVPGPGLYFVRMTTPTRSFVQRFAIMR